MIKGHGGGDVIIGEGGADELTGGAGHDFFAYINVSDSAGSEIDTIRDLDNRDTINLISIDAKTGDGDDAFVLVTAFSGTAGELTLTYDAGHQRTVVGGDVNGDGIADLTIYLSGNHTDFTHFVL